MLTLWRPEKLNNQGVSTCASTHPGDEGISQVFCFTMSLLVYTSFQWSEFNIKAMLINRIIFPYQIIISSNNNNITCSYLCVISKILTLSLPQDVPCTPSEKGQG